MGADAYRRRIADLCAGLGIPADYGRARGLSLQPEATNLERIGLTEDGRDILLAPGAAAAWRQLQSAAAADGVTLIPLSGFRSVERQVGIIGAKLARGDAIEAILRLNAAPGYSEHHTGCALDLGCPGHARLEESFAATSAFVWLNVHASAFGFRLSYPRAHPSGIAYEPWHWCWHPPKCVT